MWWYINSYTGELVLIIGLGLLIPEAVAGLDKGFIDTPVLAGCLNPATGWGASWKYKAYIIKRNSRGYC